MDITQKARMRIEHWIKHNEDHLNEYDAFAHELEIAGKNDGARYTREMMELMVKGNECLRKALKALE